MAYAVVQVVSRVALARGEKGDGAEGGKAGDCSPPESSDYVWNSLQLLEETAGRGYPREEQSRPVR